MWLSCRDVRKRSLNKRTSSNLDDSTVHTHLVYLVRHESLSPAAGSDIISNCPRPTLPHIAISFLCWWVIHANIKLNVWFLCNYNYLVYSIFNHPWYRASVGSVLFFCCLSVQVFGLNVCQCTTTRRRIRKQMLCKHLSSSLSSESRRETRAGQLISEDERAGKWDKERITVSEEGKVRMQTEASGTLRKNKSCLKEMLHTATLLTPATPTSLTHAGTHTHT